MSATDAHKEWTDMDGTLILALINIVLGILIIAFPAMLRLLIGGYLLLTGGVMLILYLL